MAKKGFIIALILTLVINTVFVFATSADSITIEAESYISNNGCSVVSGALVMPSLKDAAYSIEANSAGRYILAIRAKAEIDSFINISLNGEAFANTPIRHSDNYTNSMIYVNLPAGTHQMKLFVAGPEITMNKITITKVTDDRDTDIAFLAALDTAERETEVLSAFETYGALLGIDLESIIQHVDYKKAVYMNMANRGFDDIEEALDTLLDITERETHDPSIQLQKDGQWVKEASSGNLSLVINNSRIGERPTFGALYKGSELKELIAVGKATQINGKYIVDFGNVSINEADEINWKVFFFADLETIEPYEPYAGVYKELYVSAAGNDENDGSADKPFKTIGKAKEVAESLSGNMWGDIIINIASGEYFIGETETFDENNGGKNGFDIIYRGSNEGETVISGGKKIEGWVEGENGIWTATVDFTAELGEDFEVDDIRNLYINGIAAERSRSACRYTYLEDYDDTNTVYTPDGFVTSTTGGFPSLKKPQYAETVWEVAHRCQRLPINSIMTADDKTIVRLDSEYAYDPTTIEVTKIMVGKEYYLENDLALLDTEGEFYYDREDKRIYYYPYEEEDFEKAEKVVALTEGLIEIKGKKDAKISNLIFDKISFKYGAWNHVSTYGLLGVQADMYYDTSRFADVNNRNTDMSMLMPGQVQMDYAEDIEIRNCEFSSLGSAAIFMKEGVKDFVFEGNILKDISGTGIIIGSMNHGASNFDAETMEICQNINIRNNVFRRIATEYRQNCAITTWYENAVNIEHNDISGLPYTGISAGWGLNSQVNISLMSRNMQVSHNKITDVLETLDDGGNIYTGGRIYEIQIDNNYFARNKAGTYPGIYLDSGSQYSKVHDNLVLGNKNIFFFLQNEEYYTKYNEITNNYSDTISYSYNANKPEWDETNIVEEANPAYLEDGATLVPAAQSIYDNAGLEAKYTGLLSDVTAPSYIRNYISETPKHEDAGGKIIEFEDYDSKTGGIDYSFDVGVNKGNTFTYTIDTAESGYYQIRMYAKSVGTTVANSTMKFTINDERTYRGEFQYSATKVLNDIVVVYMPEGRNTVTTTLFSTPSLHIDCLVFKPVEDRLDEITTEAEEPSNYSGAALYSDQVSFNNTNWLEYDVYSYAPKTYDVYIYAAATGDVPLTVSVGGEDKLTGVKFAKVADDMKTYDERKIGTIELQTGNNKIKITNNGGGMHFDKVILREVVNGA